MKKIVKSRSSGMPMLEIVISIGMFTIISVFILQLFMAANNLQKDAADLSKAVIQAERIAEVLKGTDSIEGAMAYLKLSSQDNGTYQMYFDTNWKVSKDKGRYTAEIVPSVEETEQGTITTTNITIYKLQNQDKTEQLYQLPVTSYQEKAMQAGGLQ